MANMKNKKRGRSSAVITAPAGTDPRWQEKVAVAQQARRNTAATRVGKPASFRAQVGRTVG
ncbi:hypothetical protein SAMN06309944_1388 [Micrococcales bacterium KH10]|nr:hypothetical protein SAMN06309944_1388 [Micrococcales bacterium KH10]